MNRLSCLFERTSNYTVGSILFLFALFFVFTGITILPIIGFLVAFPLFALSLVFFFSKKSKMCSIILKQPHAE